MRTTKIVSCDHRIATEETQPLGFGKPNCGKFSPTKRSLRPPKPHIPCYDPDKADGKIGGNGYGRAPNGNHGGKAGGTLA